MSVRPLDKYKKICYNKRKRHFYRSGTLEKPIKHMRIPDRPCGGSGFTGKSGAYERSLEVAEILHMGCTDRKFGPSLPFPARRFWEIRTFVRVAAFWRKNAEIT